VDVRRDAFRAVTALSGASVVFRTDASLRIGSGHVVRCLSLAAVLCTRGARCRFVCRTLDGHLIDAVARAGYEVMALPVIPASAGAATSGVAHAAWLEADWETDARQTVAAIDAQRPGWLVVDHYALDARWEALLRAQAEHLLVIDDLADRSHDCDVLLDQNLGRQAGDYVGRVPGKCRVVVGPQFALLRPEFAALRESSLARRAQPRLGRVLVTMGGVDRDNVAAAVLEALQRTALPVGSRITVVMGAAAPALAAVRAQASAMRWPTEVQVGVDDMAALMAESDLAIGAAGGTAWERCCLGLPSLVVVLADNQQLAAQALDRAGAAVLLGDAEQVAQRLPAILQRLASPGELARLTRACSRVTDGRGAERVVAEMVACDG
jgi:UDP-2,4-diacetamido-2,4,6-trideoxy-beta-L-altropyranose hydrolase